LEYGETLRFNLYELTLTNQVDNTKNSANEIVKFSIDLTYKKDSEVPNSDNKLPNWPIGTVEVIVHSTFDGGLSSTSLATFVSGFKNSNLAQIRNLESPIYLGSCFDCIDYSNIMGTQTLLFSVVFLL
jgi:hypothetical protein